MTGIMGMNLNVSYEKVRIEKVRRELVVMEFVHKSTKLKLIDILEFKGIQGVE